LTFSEEKLLGHLSTSRGLRSTACQTRCLLSRNKSFFFNFFNFRFNDLKSFEHLYGGDKGRFDVKAPALKQLQINGIPHAMILGADGKMIWRGHPESIDVGEAIERALKEGKN